MGMDCASSVWRVVHDFSSRNDQLSFVSIVRVSRAYLEKLQSQRICKKDCEWAWQSYVVYDGSLLTTIQEKKYGMLDTENALEE